MLTFVADAQAVRLFDEGQASERAKALAFLFDCINRAEEKPVRLVIQKCIFVAFLLGISKSSLVFVGSDLKDIRRGHRSKQREGLRQADRTWVFPASAGRVQWERR